MYRIAFIASIPGVRFVLAFFAALAGFPAAASVSGFPAASWGRFNETIRPKFADKT
jgi:hypothetical protein